MDYKKKDRIPSTRSEVVWVNKIQNSKVSQSDICGNVGQGDGILTAFTKFNKKNFKHFLMFAMLLKQRMLGKCFREVSSHVDFIFCVYFCI